MQPTNSQRDAEHKGQRKPGLPDFRQQGGIEPDENRTRQSSGREKMIQSQNSARPARPPKVQAMQEAVFDELYRGHGIYLSGMSLLAFGNKHTSGITQP